MQEAKVYLQATIDQDGSNPRYPKFFWDNTYPGVELLLSQLDASSSDHASAVRPRSVSKPWLSCGADTGAMDIIAPPSVVWLGSGAGGPQC